MNLLGNWSYPTRIRFGAGRIREIGTACREAGISRPLFVTDKGLRDLPVVRTALDVLDSSGVQTSVFSDVDPNPSDVNLESRYQDLHRGLT